MSKSCYPFTFVQTESSSMVYLVLQSLELNLSKDWWSVGSTSKCAGVQKKFVLSNMYLEDLQLSFSSVLKCSPLFFEIAHNTTTYFHTLGLTAPKHTNQEQRMKFCFEKLKLRQSPEKSVQSQVSW